MLLFALCLSKSDEQQRLQGWVSHLSTFLAQHVYCMLHWAGTGDSSDQKANMDCLDDRFTPVACISGLMFGNGDYF